MIYTWTGAKVLSLEWEDKRRGVVKCEVDYDDGKPIEKNTYFLHDIRADDGLREILKALE